MIGQELSSGTVQNLIPALSVVLPLEVTSFPSCRSDSGEIPEKVFMIHSVPCNAVQGFEPGPLTESAPLYRFLSELVYSEHGSVPEKPEFELADLDSTRSVFLCREVRSGFRLVCKFFGARTQLPPKVRSDLMEFEYRLLISMRRLGFGEFPLRVVKPFAKRRGLDCLLAEEFVVGESLDASIAKAALNGQEAQLMEKIELLASFFATFHRRTSRPRGPAFARVCGDLREMLRELDSVELGASEQLEEISHLCDKWEAYPRMWPESSCLVHGDATPTNFIFREGQEGVTAIDLERVQVADPAYDLGMLVAEIRHHFALRILCAAESEKYIRRFFESYSSIYGRPEETFMRVTRCNPFYMALGELRMARNPWLPLEHRKWLIEEGRRCLASIKRRD